MRIRIKADGGQPFDLQLPEESTWSQLQMALEQRLGHEGPFSLQGGFPARPIEASHAQATLAQLGIRHGDTLLLAKSQSTTQPSQPPLVATMCIREMADDNSCLFSAIGYVLCGRLREQASTLRELAAGLVQGDPQYTEVVLGRRPDDYVAWICRSTSWGGAIELALFARHFSTEIASIDVASGRVDIFGQDAGYDQRVYLLYSGIHYDALAMAAFPNAPEEYDVTVFATLQDEILVHALQVAEEARLAHRYTDLARFTLRCDICGESLVGEREAEQHAHQTGHASFREYQ